MLTQSRLMSLLSYEPDTGKFVWSVSRGGKPAGKECGMDRGDGYIVIRVDKVLYLAHRLAFLWMHGAFPEALVDHVNGDKSDNKWQNLRHATSAQSLQNITIRSDNSSGMIGVSFDKRRGNWRAYIVVNSKQHHLGSFKCKRTAAEAYIAAKSRLHTFQPTIREDGL